MVKAEQESVQEESVAGLPPVVAPTPPDLDSLIADKVANAVAALIPTLVAQIGATQTANAGPSQAVVVGPTTVQRVNKFGHYRKDGVKVGKHIEFDMEKIEAGIDPNKAVKKGSWIVFTNGHVWPETLNQARQLDWMIQTQPFSGIYRDDGTSAINCPVSGCMESFTNDSGLRGHLAATHGLR